MNQGNQFSKYKFRIFILCFVVLSSGNCIAQDLTYKSHYEIENTNLKLVVNSNSSKINEQDSLLTIMIKLHNKSNVPIYFAKNYQTYQIQHDSILQTVLIDIGHNTFVSGIDYPIELIRIEDYDSTSITIKMSYHKLKEYGLAENFNLVFGIGYLDLSKIDLNGLDWYHQEKNILEIYINDYTMYYETLPSVTMSINVQD